jgi:hypothetical protein
MKKADEPAFPVTPEQARQSYSHLGSISGLTKREWFAGMAMQGLLAHYGNGDYLVLRDESYEIADAMLEGADDDIA